MTSNIGVMNCLPIELLEIIISYIPLDRLKAVSCVNRLLRQLCCPLLFKSIQVGTTVTQFERLMQISKSAYASYVRAIHYEANAILDPMAPVIILSSGSIVHPSYVRSRMVEKRKILQTSQDILFAVLPCFPNLSTIEINLVNGMKDQFGHASGSMLPYRDDYYLNPLEKLLIATIKAQQHGVTVRTFHISGFYPQAAIEDCFLEALASKVLSEVEEIRITSTSPIFPFITKIPPPRLQRLELIDIWLSLTALEELIHHAKRLRSLHLEDVWLTDEMISSAGGEFGMSKGVIILIIEILARLDRPFEITTTYCESTRRFVNQAKYTEN